MSTLRSGVRLCTVVWTRDKPPVPNVCRYFLLML